MTTTIKHFIAFGIIAVIAFALATLYRAPSVAYGSVPRGGEYQGTTTSPGNFGALTSLQTGPGTLGSVVITGANTGVMNIYDATTTNISLRTGQSATTTLLLATIPASTAAGTYTFDRLFFRGLIVETIGTSATTTITYR